MGRLTGIGYILIGGYINLTLFGVTLTQSWIYYIRFHRDLWGMKFVVLLLCCGDTANTVALCVALYQWLVQEYDPGVMLPAFLAELETSALTAIISQMFFAWRVHNLRHQWWLTSLIVFFSTCGLVGATVTTAWHRHLTRFDKLYEIQAPMLVWSSCFVACDLITATALYSTLRRSVTGFGDTDNSITRIKNLILQTSGLTMTIDLIHLIIVGIKPNYLLHFMANAAVSKVYANSLLSTLTTRSPNSTHLLGDDSGVSGPSVRISTSHMGPDSLPRTGDMFPLPALSPHWRSRGINKDTAGTAAGTDGQGLGATRLMGPVVTTVQHRFASTSADKFNMGSGVDSSGPTGVGDRDQEHDFDEEKSAGAGPRGSQLTDLEVVRTHESEPNRCHPPPPPHEA